jgi:hypothetical protein
MKVVNQYFATKEGLTAGEMEEKIVGLFDILQKKGTSVVTKENVELLESAEQEEARARKTWDFKYTTDEKMLEIMPRGRRRDSTLSFRRRLRRKPEV